MTFSWQADKLTLFKILFQILVNIDLIECGISIENINFDVVTKYTLLFYKLDICM